MSEPVGRTPATEPGLKVVAFGGGHGLSATLRSLRHITHGLTAVVTVADDGGSSGRIRAEADALPPGDLRMALVALCDESDWGLTWRDLMQQRLVTDGALNDHALGNLLILGLWQMFDDPVAGLDGVARLLDSHGRVLPMSLTPLHIEADVAVGDETKLVRGQASVALAEGEILDLRVEPTDAPVPPDAIDAISSADWIVLGPGSWFTSVIPHLMIDELRRAIVTTEAHRALVLNLILQESETQAMSSADLVRAVRDAAPDLKLDVVIADPTSVDDVDELMEVSAELGARVLLRQVHSATDPAVHDSLRLAAALRDAFDGYLAEVGKSEEWLA